MFKPFTSANSVVCALGLAVFRKSVITRSGQKSAEEREHDGVPFTVRILQVGQLNKVRILLADDHPHFPELVEGLLGPMFEVVGKVTDGRALFDAALELKPDVIVTDISMPVLNGIEAVDELRRSGCIAKIIFLTIHSDPDFIRTCLATGASGYIVKPRMALDLMLAIREVLAGHLFISPFEQDETCI